MPLHLVQFFLVCVCVGILHIHNVFRYLFIRLFALFVTVIFAVVRSSDTGVISRQEPSTHTYTS